MRTCTHLDCAHCTFISVEQLLWAMRSGNLECLDLFDRGRPRPSARGYSWRTYQSVGARPTSPVIYKLASKSFKYWLIYEHYWEGQYRWSLPGRHWARVQKNWSCQFNNHSRECSKIHTCRGSKKKIHKRRWIREKGRGQELVLTVGAIDDCQRYS